MKYQVQNNKMINKKPKFIIFLLIVLFVFNFVFVAPEKAHAQMIVTDLTKIWQDAAKWIKDAWVKTADFFKTRAWNIAYHQVFGNFLNNLAYDAAVGLAEGDIGRNPKMFTEGWGEYLTDAGMAAGGEFLTELAQGTIGEDFDICEPPSLTSGNIPNLNVKLAVNMFGVKSGERKETGANCTFSEMKDKWKLAGENAWNTIESDILKDPLQLLSLNGESLNQLNLPGGKEALLRSMINPYESDAGYVMDVSSLLTGEQEEAKKLAEYARINKSTTKLKTDPVTGRALETEAQATETEKQASAKKIELQYTGDPFADAAGVLINTLSNRLMQKGMDKLFQYLSEGERNKSMFDYMKDGDNIFALTQSNAKDYIGQIYSSIRKITNSINPTTIDLISEMSMNVRNDNLGIPGNLNDGIIDSGFVEALRRSDNGTPITLQQAIDENLINGGSIFAFKNLNNLQNLEQPNLNEGISYDNMKKLRKNRVITIGWEMAALKIKDLLNRGLNICPISGCTISDIVNAYSKFGTYKYANQTQSISDKRCGWVLASLEPYNLSEKNSQSDCVEKSTDLIKNLEFKWVGTGNVAGICYKYSFSDSGLLLEDGGVSVAESVAGVSINSESQCRNLNNSDSNDYYEWLPGGCLVKEKDESAFCGLVNPDWVLKAPAQQCFSKGYYSFLEINEDSNRYQECVDVRHCIKENEFGKCIGGYAYCLREKNVWRFQGDACDKNFSGCMTLTDDDKKTKSYIESTLEDCPQEQVGCRDYDYYKFYDNDSESYIWNNSNRKIYFGGSLASCTKKNEGCSEFVKIQEGVNLIKNGSFEIDEGPVDNKPDGWNVQSPPVDQNYQYLQSADPSLSGRYSFKSTSSGTLSTNINVPGSGIYVLSYYVKNFIDEESGEVSLDPATVTPHISNNGVDTILEEAQFSSATTTQWERKYATYYINNENSTNSLTLSLELNRDLYLDNVQFEYVDQIDSSWNFDLVTDLDTQVYYPGNYKEYGGAGNVFFKKAPDYYNCEAEPNKAECASFVKYCSKENNGCDSYRPVNGDPLITGIIGGSDKCPSECSGFQSYTEIPNYFDYLELGGLSPASKPFIALTAENCSEPSCEEFTNIDTVEQGGEGKENYKELRFCVKPEEVDTTIYYTWEGSDTSGFQLKTWKLLKSQIDGAPCTKVAIGQSNCVDDEEVESCNPDQNFDCRNFYDMQSNQYNRFESKTIPITSECINLRRTLTNTIFKVVPSLSKGCSASNVGCMEYKGNNGNNVKRVLSEDFEGGSFLPWKFGSNGDEDELTGTYSSESLKYNGHSLELKVSDDANTLMLQYDLTDNGITLSPGKQYTLSFWAKKFSKSQSYEEGGDEETPITKSNHKPVFKFVNSAMAIDEILPTEGEIIFSPGNTIITNTEWSLYEYNIVVSADNIGTVDKALLKIYFKINNANNNYDEGIYVDNIIVKEFKNNFYKIKNSWNTPKVCIDSNDDGEIDNKYLGCQEYIKRDKSREYLYKFSNLCYSENVGCRAVIDTKNSSMPFKQTFNAYCEDDDDGNECSSGKYYYLNNRDPLLMNKTLSTVSVPEDSIIYIIEDNKYKCDSKSKGCQNFAIYDDEGKPKDVFKINNPDYYITDDYFGGAQNQNLCWSDYTNCTAFTKKDGGLLFKIHPRENICEYNEEDVLSGISAGFYKLDKNESCDGILYNKHYDSVINSIDVEHSQSSVVGGKYAALCPENQNSCSTFIDSQDTINELSSFPTNITNSSQTWRRFEWNNSAASLSSSGSWLSDYQTYLIDEATQQGHLLIFAGANSPDNLKYDFSVEPNSIYKLSAFIKFNSSAESDQEWESKNRFVSTFLICREDKDSNSYYYSVGDTDNLVPYANPNIYSKNFIYENAIDNSNWKSLYGLYTMSPRANFCNLAFYIRGEGGEISIKDVKFEKINSYYAYLDNDNLDKTSCQSADIDEGCVLFHQTTNSTLNWNSEKSYENKNLTIGDSTNSGDSNILLKVIRDRECGEWATCGASVSTLDELTGQQKNACMSLVACNDLSSDNLTCNNYILRDKSIKPLMFDDYQSELGRDFYWPQMDYSGYSMPGTYPIDSLSVFSVSTSTQEYKLGKVVSKKDVNGNSKVFKLGASVANPVESYYKSLNVNKYNSGIEKSCRLYPEKDSPFVFTPEIAIGSKLENVEDDDLYVLPTSLNSRFQNANICQPIIKKDNTGADVIDYNNLNNDCDCSYTKVTYKNGKNLYFPYLTTNYPSSIKNEYLDDDDNNSVSQKSVLDYMGLRGFCLEKDYSFLGTPMGVTENQYNYRCLSWYPIDVLGGEPDVYSSAPEAKIPIIKNSKICLTADDYSIPEDRLYCAYWSSNKSESDAGLYNLSRNGANGAGNSNSVDTYARCNVLAFIPAGTKINLPLNSQDQGDLSNFLNYIMDESHWMEESPDSGYIKDEIEADDKNYSIIYGHDWEDWYANKVYNSSFRCDAYSWQTSNASNNWQEKERKFTSAEFGDFSNSYNTNTEDDSLIDHFKKFMSNVDFYFYDEGVFAGTVGLIDSDTKHVVDINPGATYRESDPEDPLKSGVYEWNRRDIDYVEDEDNNYYEQHSYYRASIVPGFNKDVFYIPFLNRVSHTYLFTGGDHQEADNVCGLMENVGEAYKRACNDAKNNLGTVGNFGWQQQVPNAHEVFTSCEIDSYGIGANRSYSQSVWNPRPYNYYVNYDFDNFGSYDDNDITTNDNDSVVEQDQWQHPFWHSDKVGDNILWWQGWGFRDHFQPNMNFVSTFGSLVQACNTYGLLDGQSQDAIFNSYNYYVNNLPLSKISQDLTVQGVCNNNADANNCLNLKVTKLAGGQDVQDYTLRIREMTLPESNFNNSNYLSTRDFANIDDLQGSSLRNPIVFDPAVVRTFSTFDGFYAKSTPSNLIFSTLRDGLSDVIVKIPEVYEYNYSNGVWIQRPNGYSFIEEGYQDSYKPIIRKVTDEYVQGITVNNVNQGDVIANKQLNATISFYAYAQTGRSPIDKISIDYGNGQNVIDLMGPFKNRKISCNRRCASKYRDINWVSPDNENNPVCSDSDTCIGGKTCFSADWGDTKESCQESKFEYSFVYVCNPSSPAWVSDCNGDQEDGVESCCKFNPKVTIYDSWGGFKEGTMGGNNRIIVNYK